MTAFLWNTELHVVGAEIKTSPMAYLLKVRETLCRDAQLPPGRVQEQ